jgi:UDP-N-acetylmuramoylalanine-D-glutamate ligase
VPHVVVIPPDGARIVDALTAAGHRLGTSMVVSEGAALDEAVRIAAQTSPVGGVVLFSPGAPTPEGQGGFGQRSRIFSAAVESLAP